VRAREEVFEALEESSHVLLVGLGGLLGIVGGEGVH
jgi:hypothetical protein